MVRRFPDAGVAPVVCGSSNSLRRVAPRIILAALRKRLPPEKEARGALAALDLRRFRSRIRCSIFCRAGRLAVQKASAVLL